MKYKNSDILCFIQEYIHSERDRNILIDRFVHGLTFTELEDKHHLSERHIKRIVKKADIFFISLLREDPK